MKEKAFLRNSIILLLLVLFKTCNVAGQSSTINPAATTLATTPATISATTLATTPATTPATTSATTLAITPATTPATTSATTPATTSATTQPTTLTATITTTGKHGQTLRTRSPRKSNQYYDYYNNDGYGDDGYQNNNYGSNDRYGENDRENPGSRGVDQRTYGQDQADFKPIRDRQESMYGSLNVWISSADDWEQKGKYRGKGYGKNRYDKGYGGNKNDKGYGGNKNDKGYGGNKNDKGYGGNKNNKDYGKSRNDKDYGDDNYKKDDYGKKPSYSKIKFPVRNYRNYRDFPIDRLPPLISIFPWLPIFYDKVTYQTLIFSPTGGIYIIPPLINFYGQRFAVAQLIKWGYASLVSTGAPPPPNINVAPLVQSDSPISISGSTTTSDPGSTVKRHHRVGVTTPRPYPSYNEKKNRYEGGVKTNFPDFQPRYSKTYYEDDYKSSYRTNYGGANQQEVRPQGGDRGASGGGYNY